MTSLSPNILLDRAIQERLATALETQPAQDGGDAFTVTYVFPAKDFGAGDFTEDIQSPTDFRGEVVGINLYDVTEVFNAVTTPARVDIGIQGGDADAYAISSSFGTLAAAAAQAFTFVSGVVGTIPAADDILITGIAPTGGTPTGIATVEVTVRYFK